MKSVNSDFATKTTHTGVSNNKNAEPLGGANNISQKDSQPRIFANRDLLVGLNPANIQKCSDEDWKVIQQFMALGDQGRVDFLRLTTETRSPTDKTVRHCMDLANDICKVIVGELKRRAA